MTVPAGQVSGIVLVIVAALLLSLKGIVAKLIYAHGVDAITVSAVRAVLAVPGFWLYALWSVGRTRLVTADRRAIRAAMFVGFVAYYLGAYLDFYALTLIDAGLERVLLFVYPAFVVTAQALIHRRLPQANVTAAMLLTYLGVFLVIGGVDRELLAANGFGSILVLLAAAGVALYYMTNAVQARIIGSQVFTVYAMTAAGVGMAGQFFLTRDVATLAMPAEAWLLMAAMVVFVTVLPLFLLGEGISRVGAVRGSLVSTVGPPSTLLVAWWLLDETMAPVQLAGSVLVIAGIIVLERFKRIVAA
ncbi:MAG: DMT family transporter [Gammaproteobacteria bacterium]|nr:DMT family transporter [Gammaproteobacteria bacterium]NNM01910.1 DMT family transporter [Gammaproteobacteria bacterium]